MYIVNTSFFVEQSAHTQWLTIINEKYIPLLNQNGFKDIRLMRVLATEVNDSFTYTLMVGIDNLECYDLLTNKLFSEYTTIAEPLFGPRVLHMVSVLKDVTL